MTEPIKWRDARKVKPRSRTDVWLKRANSEKPIKGFWDAFMEAWFRSDQIAAFIRLSTLSVTHWAPMPKGPKR